MAGSAGGCPWACRCRGMEPVPEERGEDFEALRESELKTARAWHIKETLRYLWDYGDRLVGVDRVADGQPVARYRYDALGRLVMVVDVLDQETGDDYDSRDNLIELSDLGGVRLRKQTHMIDLMEP